MFWKLREEGESSGDTEDGDRRRGREEETGAAEFRREKKGEKEAPAFLLHADFSPNLILRSVGEKERVDRWVREYNVGCPISNVWQLGQFILLLVGP